MSKAVAYIEDSLSVKIDTIDEKAIFPDTQCDHKAAAAGFQTMWSHYFSEPALDPTHEHQAISATKNSETLFTYLTNVVSRISIIKDFAVPSSKKNIKRQIIQQ